MRLIPLQIGQLTMHMEHLESMTYLASLQNGHGCRLLFGHDQAQVAGLPAEGLV